MIDQSPSSPFQNNNLTAYQESHIEMKGRLYGAGFFIVQFGCMIGYGLSSNFYVERNSSISTLSEAICLAFLGLFVLVGFGLVLSYYRYGNWLGMSCALIVLAISSIIGPLFQKLAWQIIFSKQKITTIEFTISPTIITFWEHYEMEIIESSSLLTRTTFISCISLLTMMTAIIGRIGILQILRTTIIFQFAWNINYMLLIYMCVVGDDNKFDEESQVPYFFDTFGSSHVYLFACAFGLFTSWRSCKKIPRLHPRNQSHGVSLLLCTIGTGFIFACFVFSFSKFVQYEPQGQNISKFNIFFALIGSICGTYSSSSLFGNGNKVGQKQALIGTITGGVAISFGAPILGNIGVAIGVGSVSGFLSGIYMAVIHPKINKTFMYDTLGLFGPFFISALIGSLVIAPSVLAYNYNKNQINQAFGVMFPKKLITWQLINAGISFGIGLAGSIVNWLLSIWDTDQYGMASNSRFFKNDYGLYLAGSSNYQDDEREREKEREKEKEKEKERESIKKSTRVETMKQNVDFGGGRKDIHMSDTFLNVDGQV